MTSRILYGPREKRGMRRTPQFALKAAMAAALGVLLVASAFIAIRLPSLQLREIAVSGLQTVDERAVRERLFKRLSGNTYFFLPRSSFFLADTASLGADLRAAFPAIAEIRVQKIFPGGLSVAITERAFWAIMCAIPGPEQEIAPQCVAIDRTGFAYESAPEPQGNLILTVETDSAVLATGEQQIESQLMERLHTLRDGVRAAAGQEVSGFVLRTSVPGDIRLKTADGFMVFFRRDDDFTNAFRVLKKVLDVEIGNRRADLDYIDVRFGNKVFYKFR